jgi:hypothetical protein
MPRLADGAPITVLKDEHKLVELIPLVDSLFLTSLQAKSFDSSKSSVHSLSTLVVFQ